MYNGLVVNQTTRSWGGWINAIQAHSKSIDGDGDGNGNEEG
jgi:hypothetical protein